MPTYLALWQVECQSCGREPVVGMNSPSGRIISTGLCGPCFFGSRAMLDPEDWNSVQEATE